MLTKITRHLYPEKINGRTYKASGNYKIKLEAYNRRYELLGGLFGASYQPKHDSVDINTIDIKDQQQYNTCSFNAYTAMRQVSEKIPLSVRSLVAYAKSRGYLSGNGFSNLSLNSKAGTEFGVAEESVLPNDMVGGDFDEYSASHILTKSVRDNALLHKSDNAKKFFVKTIEEYLKALDDGYAIEIGIDWYSSYNMSGGLSAPWILPWKKGTLVGGHAVLCKGYKGLVKSIDGKVLNALIKVQNSYGPDWGDHGCFYVWAKDLINSGTIGMVEVDMTDDNLAKVISSYEGKQVKGLKPEIYLIQNGVKRNFQNPETFFIFGGRYGKYGKTYIDINQSTIDEIPTGDPMTVYDSPYFKQLTAQGGLTIQFVKDNIETVQIWEENPKVLQLIVDMFQQLSQYSEPQKLSFIQQIKSLMSSNMGNKYGVFSSSEDSQKLSMTVQGILLSLVPVVVMLLTNSGYSVSGDDVVGVINTLFQIIGSAVAIYGLVRKVKNSKVK